MNNSDIPTDLSDFSLMNDEGYIEETHRLFLKPQKEIKLKNNNLLKEISTPLGTVRIVFENMESNNTKSNLKYLNNIKNSTYKYTPVLTSDGKIALLYKGDLDNVKKYESINTSLKTFKNQKHSKNQSLIKTNNDKKANESTNTSSNLLVTAKRVTNKLKSNDIDKFKDNKNIMRDDLHIHNTIKPTDKITENATTDIFNLAIIPIFDIDLERKILSKVSKVHHNHNHFKYPSSIHKSMQTAIGLAALLTCISVFACYLRRRIIRNLRSLFW